MREADGSGVQPSTAVRGTPLQPARPDDCVPERKQRRCAGRREARKAERIVQVPVVALTAA